MATNLICQLPAKARLNREDQWRGHGLPCVLVADGVGGCLSGGDVILVAFEGILDATDQL